MDQGITDKVCIPEYTEPLYFGDRCRDKVTGFEGICVARVVSLFTGDQYALEYQPDDMSKSTRTIWIDEGRVEKIEGSEKNVDPDELKGSRAGGIMSSYSYPSKPGFVNVVV